MTHLSQGIVFMAQTICAALMVLYCLMNFVKAVKGFHEASLNEQWEKGERV